MKFTVRLGMALMIGVMFLAASQASARVVNYEGPCVLGGNWTMVITIDDNTGKVTRREGINCNSTHWVDHCNIIVGTRGPVSEYYIQEVSVTPRWWIRFNTDQAGNITEMWGKDADNNNWVASVGAGGSGGLE